MGRRRRSDIADGLEVFKLAYSTTKGLMGDYAVSKGMSDARKEAEASGGTDYTLDKGGDDASAPDLSYSSKGAKFADKDGNVIANPGYTDTEAKAARDAGLAQAKDIESMQAEIDAEKAGPSSTSRMADALNPTGKTTPGLADVKPIPTAASLSATQGMAQALNPNATDAQIAAIEKSPGLSTTEAPAPAGYAAGEVTKPKFDTMDVFHRKYAPRVIAQLMEQGNEAKAREFETWARSEKGARYGDAWLKAMAAEQAGDHHGAMVAVQDLYNKQMPDGRYAIAKPGKDGQYAIEVRDEKTNKVLQQFAGKAPDLSQALLGMGAPDKVWSHLQALDAAKVKREQEIEDRNFKATTDKEIAAMKDRPNSGLGKLIAERDALDPRDPQYKQKLAIYDDAINKTSTRGEGGGPSFEIKISPTPQEMAGGGQGVVVTDPKKRTASLVPLAGAPNKVEQANALLAQVSERPSASGYGTDTYLNGKKVKKDDPLYEEIQKARAVLAKQKPGLK